MKINYRFVSLLLAVSLVFALLALSTQLAKNQNKISDEEFLFICESGSGREVAHAIHSEGANVNAKDENGKTALMYAVQNANFEAIEVLLKAGANTKRKDKSGKTAFDYTIYHDTRFYGNPIKDKLK